MKPYTPNSGNAIETAGAIAPSQKEESILVGRALTMETILCLIKTLLAKDMDETNSSSIYLILFEKIIWL